MDQIVYLNGTYRPLSEASVSVQDRGFLFGDGVYEVVRYYNGSPLAMEMHLRRLHESLRQIRLTLPEDGPDFPAISEELVRRNDCPDGCVYWQVTRGAAPRSHTFPAADARPTIYAAADPAEPLVPDAPVPKLTAIRRPETRWQHCHIKTVSLLPNVLDAQAAADAGSDEAILLRDGIVTEGTRRSILVVRDGVLRTHPLDGRILDSITRRLVLDHAREAGHQVDENAPTEDELMSADEVIAVGSTTEVAAVTHIDAQPVGRGEVGPVAQALFDLYKQLVQQHCGQPTS